MLWLIACVGIPTCISVWRRFFFQAEDGIRDLIVTGVQTCALPISPLPCHACANANCPANNIAHANTNFFIRIFIFKFYLNFCFSNDKFIVMLPKEETFVVIL